MSKGARSRRGGWADRWAPVIVLVFCLVMAAGLGVYPIWHYVDTRWPGVPVQQARVTSCSVVHMTGIVCATTKDGSQIAVEWSGHLLYPRTGSQLTVFHKHGHWWARKGTALPWWAPIPLLLFGAGAVGCTVTLLRRLSGTLRRVRRAGLFGR